MSAALDARKPFEIVADSLDREVWLKARHGAPGAWLVTASDVPTLMGVGRWGSVLELYMERLGLAPERDDDPDYLEWGIVMEKPILEWYRRQTGREAIANGMLYRSVRYPWIGATFDAEALVDGNRIPVEIKTTAYCGADWSGGVPDYYMPQVQTQILVMGAPFAAVAVSIAGRPPTWIDVERDEEMIAEIVRVTRAFVDRLDAEEPPPPDGSDSAARMLRALYPAEEPGKVVTLDQDAVEWDERLKAIAAEEKRLKAEREALRQKIEAQIGDAEMGVLPGNLGAYRWATTERKGYTVKATSYRQLRRRKA